MCFGHFRWLDGLQESAYTSLFGPFIAKRGGRQLTLDEVRYNASLMLTNAYVSTTGATSLPQSHKYIGGYHIDDTVKPLPEVSIINYDRTWRFCHRKHKIDTKINIIGSMLCLTVYA